MIPAKSRRVIETVFDLHPDLELHMDEDLADGTFGVIGEYGEDAYIIGSTRMINWARDIRENVLVPECFSDEASTWS